MYQACNKIVLKNDELEIAGGPGGSVAKHLNEKAYIDVEGDGNNLLFFFVNENINDVYVKIKSSDNVFCGGDKTIRVPGNYQTLYYLEAAPYVQQSGEYRGKILLEINDSGLSLSVIETI